MIAFLAPVRRGYAGRNDTRSGIRSKEQSEVSRTSAWHCFSMQKAHGANVEPARQAAFALPCETEKSSTRNRRYRLLTIRRSTNNDVGEGSLWAEVVIALENACQLYGESFLNFSQARPRQWVGRSRCRPALRHRDSLACERSPAPLRVRDVQTRENRPSPSQAQPAKGFLFLVHYGEFTHLNARPVSTFPLPFLDFFILKDKNFQRINFNTDADELCDVGDISRSFYYD